MCSSDLPLVGWKHRPGAHGWAQQCVDDAPEWRSYTRINDHGLRDRDVPYARTAAFRILVLGDSFTEGMQVDEDATFPKRLEATLAAGGQPGLEVINAGMSAWATDNELLFFLDEGWKYRPDVVLLAFDTMNDVLENQRALLGRTGFYPDKPYFAFDDGRLTLRHFPLPLLPRRRRIGMRLDAELFLRSALFRRLAELPSIALRLQLPAPRPLLPGPPPEILDAYRRTYPPVWQEAWRITRGLVLRLRRAVEDRGAHLVVVIVNPREEVARRRWQAALALPVLQGQAVDVDKPNRLITRFLARRGIPAIPLLDEFRAHVDDDGKPAFFDWDIHWTAAGHDLAARVIAARLRDLGLVPGTTTRSSTVGAGAP